MRGFDNKFLDELKSKNDIVDVISRYVRLEQKGRNFWGKCPFHHEKTPSFCVNSDGQFFNCFGCHKSGDVISFIMEIESLDFMDAVKLLAERAKIPLPEARYDDEKIKEQKKQKERVLDLLRDTAIFYAKNLKSDKAYKHVEYLLKRKISSEFIAKFGIGASLDFASLPKYLLEKGYTYEEMLLSGAVSVKDGRYFDALGGRLIIPMINQFNQVIAFVGRVLEKTDFGKYVNTKETIVFSKSNTLFNINNLKKLKNEKGLDSVIIVEGHIDVVSLYQAGVKNVVASMGTALTKDHARILKRYAEKIFISYDGDFAGQKAAIRGLEILKEEGLDVKVVSLPDGMDPDDIIQKYGKEGFDKCLFEAKPLIDFKLDILKKTFDVNTVDGKRKYVVNAVKVIRESPSPAEQEDLLKTVRDITGITFESLKRELYSSPSENKPTTTEIPEFSENTGDKIVTASRFILYSYLFNKPYALETDLSELKFFTPLHNEIQSYILKCNRDGETARFSHLYDISGKEDGEELSMIASLDVEEDKKYNKASYFSDCISTLKTYEINSVLENLTALFATEKDTEKRREIAKQMSEMLKRKNELSKK